MTTDALVATLPIDLTRDAFLRTLIRELAGTLQEVVGLEEAAGFISVVVTAQANKVRTIFYRES